MSLALRACVDDLSSRDVRELIVEHLRGMHAHSPPESVYALPLDALKAPEITFWSIWHGEALCGCVALKELSPSRGEIKSMRTRRAWLRRGVGQFALDVVLRTARERGYVELLLETGTGEAFDAAQALYRRNGFAACGPFGGYVPTSFNVFMSRRLQGT